MYRQIAIAVLLACSADSLPLVAAPTTRPANRDARAILADFDAVVDPTAEDSKLKEEEYIKQLQAAYRVADLKKASLAKELYDVEPTHPKAAQLMVRRWDYLIQYNLDWKTTAAESKQFLDAHPMSAHTADALHHRASALVYIGTFEEALQVTEQFIALKPDDHERGAYLLKSLSEETKDAAKWRQMHQRIIDQFKGTPSAKWAAGRLRRRDGVGNPFDLSFTDVKTGSKITIADLKGKIVVVDFWATWCRPCVAEIPKLKEIYAAHKHKGVEFIGVSLDGPVAEGGLEKLKRFIAENNVPWPQYYQGDGWNSDFSGAWGIHSIPSMFIVDAEGNLHSTEARQNVAEQIQALLTKRDSAPVKN